MYSHVWLTVYTDVCKLIQAVYRHEDIIFPLKIGPDTIVYKKSHYVDTTTVMSSYHDNGDFYTDNTLLLYEIMAQASTYFIYGWPGIQMSCKDLATWQGTSMIAPQMAIGRKPTAMPSEIKYAIISHRT